MMAVGILVEVAECCKTCAANDLFVRRHSSMRWTRLAILAPG